MKTNGIFIKWAGGKSQLIEQYRPFFPNKIERYFEPFLGSGAVFFFVKKTFNPKEISLSDTNEELIIVFKVVRDNVEELIKSLKKRKALNSREYFYKVRKEEPAKISSVERASRLIYLNKTCYNGLYRVNAKGEFNVPYGKYKNPSIFNEKILREGSRLLKNVKIKVASFEMILDHIKKGDFIYFDPPYMPISKTSSFTSYTKDVFLENEQEKLAKVFRQLDKKGCLLMLSNSDHSHIRKLYAGFNIQSIKARRAISCIGTKRGEIKELLITNYQIKNLKEFTK
jgi:DNA adenine methylase